MVSGHLTALARGAFLLAASILAAHTPAPTSRSVDAPPQVSAREDSQPAQIDQLHEDDQLALECEEVEVERTDGKHEATDDGPTFGLPTTPRRFIGVERVLRSRDAVALHGARGPPAV